MTNSRRTQVDSLQGTLTAMILKSLSWGPRHGYAIARWIEDVADAEVLVEEGSLYPTLRRLEGHGWVTSEWGISDTKRRVRIYALTEEGRQQLRAELDRWEHFAAAVSRVLGSTQEEPA